MFGFGKKYKAQIALLQKENENLRIDNKSNEELIDSLRAENAKLKEAAAKKAARKTSTTKTSTTKKGA